MAVSAKQDVAEMQGSMIWKTIIAHRSARKWTWSHYQSSTGLTEDEITQNLKKLEAMYLVLKDEMKRRPTQDVRDALVLNLLFE